MRTAGARYEDIAVAHIARSGLRLLARNFNCRHGELDLVMREGDVIVFAEVRYRRADGFGGAAASVGAAKRRRLIAAAQLFLQANPAYARLGCRFDVLALAGDPAHPSIEWLRDAFQTD